MDNQDYEMDDQDQETCGRTQEDNHREGDNQY